MPPLRRRSESDDSENSPDSPEAQLISAYLESGRFTPYKNGVNSDDIVAWKPLWELCLDYQEKEGKAPPIALVKAKFPDFQILPGLGVTWAAQQVIDAANSRTMRSGIQATLKALNEENLIDAYSSLEKVKRPRGFRKEPTSVFDHSVISDRFNIGRIEVPYPTLMRASHGGIAKGELWYLAARFGQGKSWEVHGYAATAAEAGCRVALGSYEMPAGQVGFRMLRRLAGKDVSLQKMLGSDAEADRKEAADIIAGRTPGIVDIYDPSHGKINNTTAVHDLCEEYDLVILDHVGLMQDGAGRRAVDDWRVMGSISNVLREITLETMTPVLGVAQVNREGAKTGPWTPPKADNLSQSDFLGMDADVIITLKRPTEGGRVMVHNTAKMRDAPRVKWYTYFDPSRGIFHEITHEQARELDMVDEANEDS